METKFKLGDIVYIMHQNIITKCIITGIILHLKSDLEKHTIQDVFTDYIHYNLHPIAEYVGANKKQPLFSIRKGYNNIAADEDDIYSSKKMLLLHLDKNAQI